MTTSDWYRQLHARPEFVAAAERQRQQRAALIRRYPGTPFIGPNFAGGAKYLAAELGLDPADVAARARAIWARGEFV